MTYDQEYKDYLASPDGESAKSLQQDYDQLFEFLTALARSKAQMLGGKRLPATKFRALYNAVQKGEITPEQLQLAPTLKKVNPKDLAGSPELLDLQQKLWGAA